MFCSAVSQIITPRRKNLTRTIVHDIFSPPVASRIYLYANAAAYEALVAGDTKYKSLHGQIKNFPDVKKIRLEGKINHPLAAVYAFLKPEENSSFLNIFWKTV
ncbi:hypothetical protein [Dyadobacter sp. NIV53]|uniref:hypothetical protein n=1 Tax=Dyadobacter sp. NIV53 TaxID=2861765 RepID=UPI001C87B8BC|nr:hypothetical protein [Dyadobacter sp. NIV53]